MYKKGKLRTKFPELDYNLPIFLPRADAKTKRLTLKQTEKYHRKRKVIPSIIVSAIDDHEVVYGARAINKRLPKHLQSDTHDYDIYTPFPKKDAREVEKELDKHFNGDFFFVERANHPGTFRVRSHADGKTHADYTKLEGEIPFDKIDGIKYEKLNNIKGKIKKTLDNPMAYYRHQKDRDALNRILLFEKKKRRR